MRTATIKRKTKETDIEVSVNLDGTGVSNVATGIGFLDHMLDLLARHSRIDVAVKAAGDLHIDHRVARNLHDLATGLVDLFATVFIVPPRRKASCGSAIPPYTFRKPVIVTWFVPSPPLIPRTSMRRRLKSSAIR